MTLEQLRTYKHQLTAEEFTFAFTATAEEFATRADEMRGKGVERLTRTEIRKNYGIHAGWIGGDAFFTLVAQEGVFTLVVDAEVRSEPNETITFQDILAPVPSLLLWRSKIPALILMACTLSESENNQDTTSFHFIETMMGDFSIEKQSTTGEFFIERSTTGDFDIRQQSTTGHFDVWDQSTTGRFIIRDRGTTGHFNVKQSTTGDFVIQKHSTTDNFFILKNSTTGHFYIQKHSTTGGFYINHSTTGDFDIRQSTTGDFYIGEQATTGNFLIGKQSTMGDFTINNSEIAILDADGLFSSFDLTKATMTQFRLQNCNIPELRIASGCRIECYVAHSTINLIDLQHLTLSKESVVSLFDCTVYACLMEEFAVLGSLFFRQIKKANRLFAWYDLEAKSEENARRLAVLKQHAKNYDGRKAMMTSALGIDQPMFRIVQSSLGKTEFTNCDLGDFRFEFNNAKITEVFMSGGTVPEENIFIHGETEDSLAWHEQKVSVYNQLKKIFDGQGDVYWATHFQAKTAEHQQRVLQLRLQTEDERFSTTFWDLWTFRLNQWSNLHGESWGQALLFTLGVAALFYVLFLSSIGRLFQPTEPDWNLVGQYFQFLDPTHKIDFVKDATLNVGSYVFDYTGRVFIAYGIYQLISAFRKHGKK